MTVRRFVCENYPIDQLPRDLHPQLPEGRSVRVVIEDEISDEELRAEFDREIALGIADLDAGRWFTAEEVRAEMRARFGPLADAAE